MLPPRVTPGPRPRPAPPLPKSLVWQEAAEVHIFTQQRDLLLPGSEGAAALGARSEPVSARHAPQSLRGSNAKIYAKAQVLRSQRGLRKAFVV
eukprot:s3519_g4.t1